MNYPEVKTSIRTDYGAFYHCTNTAEEIVSNTSGVKLLPIGIVEQTINSTEENPEYRVVDKYILDCIQEITPVDPEDLKSYVDGLEKAAKAKAKAKKEMAKAKLAEAGATLTKNGEEI